MKREAGYTLLELLVVLAIMGILLASIPGMAVPGIDGIRFSGKVQAIASRLERAHEAAIASGQVETVPVAVLRASAPGVTLASEARSIVFFPDGSASPSNLWVKSDSHVRGIVIDAITGRVAILTK